MIRYAIPLSIKYAFAIQSSKRKTLTILSQHRNEKNHLPSIISLSAMINALIYGNSNDPFFSRGLLRNNCKYVSRNGTSKNAVTIFKFIAVHYKKNMDL